MIKIDVATHFKKLLDKANESALDESILFEAIHFQKPYIFVGVNWPSLQRCMYIDITDENWTVEQLKSFPRWRGLELGKENLEKIGRLKNKTMLVISQDVENSEEIFEQVLQNLVDHLFLNESPLYTVIYEVLDRWHNFFKRKYDKRLTVEEEMGLFGELYYLNEWLEKFPQEPPLIIKQWKGPLKNRIDFVNNGNGIEIKTISPKVRDEIKIANEKQLEINAVISNLYLYVLKIEISDSVGKTLQQIIETIEEKLVTRAPSIAVKFRDLLVEVGVMDTDYNDNYFYVHKELAYSVSEKFPRLTSSDLRTGITNVSYSIDLSHCKEFEIDSDNIFRLD